MLGPLPQWSESEETLERAYVSNDNAFSYLKKFKFQKDVLSSIYYLLYVYLEVTITHLCQYLDIYWYQKR